MPMIMARQHLAATVRHIELDLRFEYRQQFTLPDALAQTTVYRCTHMCAFQLRFDATLSHKTSLIDAIQTSEKTNILRTFIYSVGIACENRNVCGESRSTFGNRKHMQLDSHVAILFGKLSTPTLVRCLCQFCWFRRCVSVTRTHLIALFCRLYDIRSHVCMCLCFTSDVK